MLLVHINLELKTVWRTHYCREKNMLNIIGIGVSDFLPPKSGAKSPTCYQLLWGQSIRDFALTLICGLISRGLVEVRVISPTLSFWKRID